MDNYEYFKTLDWKKYRGQFVVVANTSVVLHGHDPDPLLDEAKQRFPQDIPFVIYIADGPTRITHG